MSRRIIVASSILLAFVIAGSLLIGLGTGGAGASCSSARNRTRHVVALQSGQVSAATVRGRRCDTLTITNKDAVEREIAFGPHDHHVPYDGVSERVLDKGQSLTVTLDQTGTYQWHDHLHDEVKGSFVVTD